MNKCCRNVASVYIGRVKYGSVVKLLAVAATVLCLGTGCGGLYGSQAVSPLMFFLPGLVQAKPVVPQPNTPGQAQTNNIVAKAY